MKISTVNASTASLQATVVSLVSSVEQLKSLNRSASSSAEKQENTLDAAALHNFLQDYVSEESVYVS